MTVKQENRVRKAMRDRLDLKMAGWHENPSMRRLQEEIKLLKEEIADRDEILQELRSQNLRLDNELENKEERIAQNVAAAQRSSDDERANTEHFRTLWLQERSRSAGAQRNHKKASAILRRLPPAEYHQLHQDAMDLHPDLWLESAYCQCEGLNYDGKTGESSTCGHPRRHGS